jgi:acetone carboxylase gamma subunit
METCPYCGNELPGIKCDECGDEYCEDCIKLQTVEVWPKRLAHDTGKPLVNQKYLCPNCDGRAEKEATGN